MQKKGHLHVLLIKETHSKDEGQICVTASNDVGVAKSSCLLKVHGKIMLFSTYYDIDNETSIGQCMGFISQLVQFYKTRPYTQHQLSAGAKWGLMDRLSDQWTDRPTNLRSLL